MNNYEKLKEYIEKYTYPISVICLIADFIGYILKIPKNKYLNVVSYVIIITITVLLFILLLINTSKKNRIQNDINLYNTLMNERSSLFSAIKLILNQKGNINKTRIDLAHLTFSLINLPKAIDNPLEQRFDASFYWDLKGTNSTDSPLDKIFFRLAGDNTTKLESLKFYAYDCRCNIEKECMKPTNSYFKCFENDNCLNFKMNADPNYLIEKDNFFLVPLQFSKELYNNESYHIKVNYQWEKCYNPLVDHLIFDSKNFSTELNAFKAQIKIDGIIITNETNVMLYSLSRKPSKTEKHHCLGKLKLKEEGADKFWVSDDIKVDTEKIYYVEINNKNVI